MTNVVINGQHYDRVFGGSVPAPIWAEFMTYVHAGLPVTDFPPEPGNIQKWLVPPPTTVPDVIGLDARTTHEAELRQAKLERFRPSRSRHSSRPGPWSTSHQAVGPRLRQGSFVTIYVSTGEIPAGALPNLTGLTFDEALEIVRSFELDTGVRVNLIQQNTGTTDPAIGRSHRQHQPATGNRRPRRCRRGGPDRGAPGSATAQPLRPPPLPDDN